MAAVHIRLLDDAVVQRLKERAVAHQRSLEAEIRHILEQAVQDNMEQRRQDFVSVSRRLRREVGGRRQTPSELLIREDRDGAHRTG